MKKLFGVTTAMTTPFDKGGNLDTQALAEQTEFLINKGVNCLYPCGTTGEMYLMSIEERKLAAETVVKAAAGRVTVYIHIGAMTTEDSIALAKHAYAIGADGIGAVTPSYFGVSDRALITYYKDISASVPGDFPIYLYGIPQCAVNDIKPEVARELAKSCTNIIGIKYSYADMVRVNEYLSIPDFSVMVGADRLFYPALCMGCDGTVSGCSDAMPEHFVAVYRAYLEGDHKKARREQAIANEIVNILKAGSDMGIFKAALDHRGVAGGNMRKPLLDITEEQKKELIEQLDRYL